jgi:hypothetical protein
LIELIYSGSEKGNFLPPHPENVVDARKKIETNILAPEENFQFHKLLTEVFKHHVFVMAWNR